MKYAGFISHSHHDSKHAKWLHRALRRYRTPSKYLKTDQGESKSVSRKLGRFFLDGAEARSGKVTEVLKNALMDSSSLIVICSPNAATSKWVNEEIELYKQAHDNPHILAIIVDGAPNSGEPSTECFPPALKGTFELIAGDVRKSRRNAFLMVVAGLLHVDLDDLIQKDHWRSLQHRIFATIFAIVVLLSIWFLLKSVETSRLANIGQFAASVNPLDDPDAAALLTISSSPTVFGSLSTPDDLLPLKLRGTANSRRSNFAGYSASLMSDYNTEILLVNSDQNLALLKDSGSGDYPETGLFVFNLPQDKLTARIPLETSLWSRKSQHLTYKDLLKQGISTQPKALAVTKDGRTIVGIYQLEKKSDNRTVAVWKLSHDGSCEGICMPSISIMKLKKKSHPVPPPRYGFVGLRVGSLRLESNGNTGIYWEENYEPHLLSLNQNEFLPFVKFSKKETNQCILEVPQEITIQPSWQQYWPEELGRALAFREHDERTISFMSSSSGREKVRLRFPDVDESKSSVAIEILFLDEAKRVLLVSNQDLISKDEAVRIYGSVDLEKCKWETWPVSPLDLNSGLTKPLFPTENWEFHSYEGFAISPDSQYVAISFTLTIEGDYQDFVQIISIDKQKPVAIIRHPENSSDFSLIPGTKPYPFFVSTYRKVFPVQPDFTLGKPVNFPSVLKEEWSRRNKGGGLFWDSRSNETLAVVNPRTLQTTTARFYDGRVRVKVSRNGSVMAMVQSDYITVQKADSGAISSSIRIPANHPKRVNFSPDSRLLAVQTQKSAIFVWKVKDGELVGTIDSFDGTQLSIRDSGEIIYAHDSAIKTINIYSKTSQTLIHEFDDDHRLLTAKQVGNHLFIYSGKGHLAQVENDLTVSQLTKLSKLSAKELITTSTDGNIGYFTNPWVKNGKGYFFDFGEGSKLSPIPNEALRGTAEFLPSGEVAILAEERNRESIQLWHPNGSAPITTIFRFDQDVEIKNIWHSPNGNILWAVDQHGRFYSFPLSRNYLSSFSDVCLTLRQVGAPLEFSDEELESNFFLNKGDKAPCLRQGWLAKEFYFDFLKNTVRFLTNQPEIHAPSDCNKIKDTISQEKCKKRFENRWKYLESLSSK